MGSGSVAAALPVAGKAISHTSKGEEDEEEEEEDQEEEVEEEEGPALKTNNNITATNTTNNIHSKSSDKAVLDNVGKEKAKGKAKGNGKGNTAAKSSNNNNDDDDDDEMAALELAIRENQVTGLLHHHTQPHSVNTYYHSQS